MLNKTSQDRGILHIMKEDVQLVSPYRIPACQNCRAGEEPLHYQLHQLEQRHQQKCVSTQQKLRSQLQGFVQTTGISSHCSLGISRVPSPPAFLMPQRCDTIITEY